MAIYEKRRILIWGKTAPELSTTYYETVCTGGVFEDGTPVRLYPIPLRVFENADRFRKYQWITVPVTKNPSDTRPESYRVKYDEIEVGEFVPPDDLEWYGRREIVFQQSDWRFDSLDDLIVDQERTRRSIAVVSPTEIISVGLHERDDKERLSFEDKKAALTRKLQADREQLRLFEECMPDEMKGIDFIKNRVSVKWKCAAGKVHEMQIMDWEVVELQRKAGDDKAVDAVRKHLDLTKYATRFYLGSIFNHPTRFTIVGLWYPKRQTSLFPS